MTIYFVQAGDTGNIKIGYTAGSAEKRVAQLQTGNIFDLNLLGTIPGSMEDEKAIHRELAQYALRGEWFSTDQLLLRVIGEMIENQLPWYHCRKVRLDPQRMTELWESAFSAARTCITANESTSVPKITVRQLNNGVRAYATTQAFKKSGCSANGPARANAFEGWNRWLKVHPEAATLVRYISTWLDEASRVNPVTDSNPAQVAA